MRPSGQLTLPACPTLDDLVTASVALLQEHAPPGGKPYHLAFSGGKDSTVILALADLAGVPYEAHYALTTIDPPELYRFIRREHPDVIIDKPRHGSFFRRMEVKGFPTRRGRWCCEEFKEASNPAGARVVLGIRAEESPQRAATWGAITKHRRTGEIAVLPIFGWASDEIWEYIHREGLPYCELYDEGFHRLGCIGCPMAREAARLAEFARWPAYERRWRLAFERIWEKRAGTTQRDGRGWFGSARFDCWEDMWDWWVSDRPMPLPRDGGLFDEEDDDANR